MSNYCNSVLQAAVAAAWVVTAGMRGSYFQDFRVNRAPRLGDVLTNTNGAPECSIAMLALVAKYRKGMMPDLNPSSTGLSSLVCPARQTCPSDKERRPA